MVKCHIFKIWHLTITNPLPDRNQPHCFNDLFNDGSTDLTGIDYSQLIVSGWLFGLLPIGQSSATPYETWPSGQNRTAIDGNTTRQKTNADEDGQWAHRDSHGESEWRL
jgi:hypothetical protein